MNNENNILKPNIENIKVENNENENNIKNNQEINNINNNEEQITIPDWDLVPPFETVDRSNL